MTPSQENLGQTVKTGGHNIQSLFTLNLSIYIFKKYIYTLKKIL